jgi:hypothetical protein
VPCASARAARTIGHIADNVVSQVIDEEFAAVGRAPPSTCPPWRCRLQRTDATTVHLLTWRRWRRARRAGTIRTGRMLDGSDAETGQRGYLRTGERPHLPPMPSAIFPQTFTGCAT